MNDLISRQAAIEALKQQAETMSEWSNRYAEQRKGILTAVNIVEDLPPAQPERIKGRWVLVTDNNGQHFECNHCGEWRYHQEQKFCGECGAEMEVTT